MLLGKHPGIIVVNANYRHTPEFAWPTQFNDAWDSFIWLSEHIVEIGEDPSQVVLGGISAGAGLAAGVVLHRQELLRSGKSAPPITVKGQVLCSPWILHPSASPFATDRLSSFNQNQMAPNLPWSALKLYSGLLGDAAIIDPQFNIALSTDEQLRGMPKTSILVSGADLLRDEGLYYAEKLKEIRYVARESTTIGVMLTCASVPTKTHVFPGLPHGFRRFTTLWSAKRWEEVIGESIVWCLSEDIQSRFSVESRPDVSTMNKT